ncbi:MAG: heavy metal-responsive transcriptional regulator [Nitrososphaera sp.]|nr:heavy metal-responsive transcriptional regulator [Nitrososphaera sp.]
MPGKRYFIGEVAKELGISPKTVRWYEAQGFLNELSRTEAGYRSFNAEDKQRLRFIRKAFALGFSSKEVKDILELRAHGTSPCELVIDLIGSKIDTIQDQIEDLQQLEKKLLELRRQWQKKRTRNQSDKGIARVCPCIEEAEESKGRRRYEQQEN